MRAGRGQQVKTMLPWQRICLENSPQAPEDRPQLLPLLPSPHGP